MAKLQPWPANLEVMQFVEEIQRKNHYPRLSLANIAVGFNDTKPFNKDRFNLGRVTKFTNKAKLWHSQNKKYDFEIMLCATAWKEILSPSQREALVDFHLCRCSVEYEPVRYENEKGKLVVSKDTWGRIEYSDRMRFDDLGNPLWKLLPLDIHVYTENIKRYGPWCEDFADFKEVVEREVSV